MAGSALQTREIKSGEISCPSGRGVEGQEIPLDRGLEKLAEAALKIFSGEALLPETPVVSPAPGLAGAIVGPLEGALSALARLSEPSPLGGEQVAGIKEMASRGRLDD